ncbi:DnaJ domain-containing protein [Streptomyces bottropensis]|uniref:DnaJ domain-containing protein n=1 Tax=Streptomyces bottropensis TaxID=42235 RepID=UPI0036903D91
MQARDEGADLYVVLGVEPSATAEVITSAFRARVRELRPDTRVDAATAERFGEVRAAYERSAIRFCARPTTRGTSGRPSGHTTAGRSARRRSGRRRVTSWCS